LDPYLQSVTSDFKHGANFATAGATVRPVTYLSPFYLPVQVLQFLSFRRGVMDMHNRDKWTWTRSSTDVKSAGSFHAERLNRLPPPEYFEKALYAICIGGNDYTYGYTKGQSIDEVKKYLPEVAEGIGNAIQRIHDEGGGRYFLIWDMEPQGCLPYMKTLIWHEDKDRNEMDCLPAYNEAAHFLNDLLNSTLEKLRERYTDSTIVFLSTYQMKMDIFKDPPRAGFKTVDKACCGIPNRWHYDLRVACGQSNVFDNVTLTSEACTDPNEYVVWDGVHTTEAANRYQAKKIFEGTYFYPPFPKLTEGCDLSSLT
jgi:phospholipase/lecithinase/hemolysin